MSIQTPLPLWKHFCEEHLIREQAVTLFESDGMFVNTIRYGKNQRLVLKRSQAMDQLVIREVSKVLQDYENQTDLYDGLIYLMLWLDEGVVQPLYIGKSEKFGLSGSNLSANIKNIARNQGNFCRWGYNYAYHIGDLSAVVCPDHPADKKNPKYEKWAQRLFLPGTWPGESPQLQQEIYFWITAWKTGAVGIWEEYGATRLTFLEYLLIGVASDLFPGTLLNRDGVNRE